jgi:hypothetical protein
MSSASNIGKHPDIAGKLEQKAEQAGQTVADPREAARRRRLAALKAAEGLWMNRTDVPRDGVEAQEQLRSEWP